MCKKKERIIEALRSSGMDEHEAIATEIEIGKISLVGCTTYRDETNKRIMRCITQTHPSDPEEGRVMAHRLMNMLMAEKAAMRGSQAVAERFYTRINRA